VKRVGRWHLGVLASRVTRRASRHIIGIALTAMLSACVVTSPSVESPTRNAFDLQNWQANGRMAVAGANGGGSGSFTWRQTGNEAVVQLRGPIGIGSLRLLIDDQTLRIDTGDGKMLEAEAAQAELAARLGAEIPTQSLRYWLLGQPAPGEHTLVQSNETAILEQSNWRVDYQRYAVTDGVRLPSKWVAVSGPAKVRIIVDRWRLQ
jgi:outer membrane lipoprotein LolB